MHKKHKRLFFDTEFSGLQQNTSLISIGIVSEDGKSSFYAELTDFNATQINTWLKKHVLSKLLYRRKKKAFITKNKNHWHLKGDHAFLHQHLAEWLSGFSKIEFWSDCPAWDWVLFCEIFGGALSLPENIFYMPFDFASLLRIHLPTLSLHFPKMQDPDYTRENLLDKKQLKKLHALGLEKHNALYDAHLERLAFGAVVKKLDLKI